MLKYDKILHYKFVTYYTEYLLKLRRRKESEKADSYTLESINYRRILRWKVKEEEKATQIYVFILCII